MPEEGRGLVLFGAVSAKQIRQLQGRDHAWARFQEQVGAMLGKQQGVLQAREASRKQVAQRHR